MATYVCFVCLTCTQNNYTSSSCQVPESMGSNGMVLKNGLGGNIYHHLCKPLTLQNVIIQRYGGVEKYRKTMVVCCLFLVVLLHRVLRYVEFFCNFFFL